MTTALAPSPELFTPHLDETAAAPAPRLDASFRPIVTAPPQWSCRTAHSHRAVSRAHDGLETSIQFIALPADTQTIPAAPDRSEELVIGPVRQKVLDALAADKDVMHLKKIQLQLRDAEQAERLATARLVGWRGTRDAAVIEAAPGLAARLQGIDGEIGEWEAKQAAARQDCATLRPLVHQYVEEITRRLDVLARVARTEVTGIIHAARLALLAELAQAAGPVLDRLATLELAHSEINGAENDARRAGAKYLAELPVADVLDHPACATAQVEQAVPTSP